MKLIRLSLAALAVTGASVACVLSATPTATAATARASRSYTISAISSRSGKVLVSSNGVTLYVFTRDHGASDSCAEVSGCLSVWPIASASGHVTAGPGVNSRKIGSIKVGSKRQLTYYGHPLYGYSQSDAVGITSYIGTNEFGGDWDVITTTGKVVK